MSEGMRTVRLKADAAGEVLSGHQIETDSEIDWLDRIYMHIATIGEAGSCP